MGIWRRCVVAKMLKVCESALFVTMRPQITRTRGRGKSVNGGVEGLQVYDMSAAESRGRR